MSDLGDTLARSPLLSSLDRRTVDRLARDARRRTYEAGEHILTEGDSAVGFYIVVRGRVAFSRGGGDGSVDLGTVGAGGFFGELALIEDHARTATVTAVEETECIILPVWEFRALLDEQPEMARVIMEQLIRRMHRAEH